MSVLFGKQSLDLGNAICTCVVMALQFSQSPRLHAVWLYEVGFQLHASTARHAALHSVSPSQSLHSSPQQYESNFQASPSPMQDWEIATSVIVAPTSASLALDDPPNTFRTVFTTSSVTPVFVVSLRDKHFAIAAPDAAL